MDPPMRRRRGPWSDLSRSATTCSSGGTSANTTCAGDRFEPYGHARPSTAPLQSAPRLLPPLPPPRPPTMSERTSVWPETEVTGMKRSRGALNDLLGDSVERHTVGRPSPENWFEQNARAGSPSRCVSTSDPDPRVVPRRSGTSWPICIEARDTRPTRASRGCWHGMAAARRSWSLCG